MKKEKEIPNTKRFDIQFPLDFDEYLISYHYGELEKNAISKILFISMPFFLLHFIGMNILNKKHEGLNGIVYESRLHVNKQ